MTAFDSAPSGTRAWWCPHCERATVTSYRCSNWDCAKNLAGQSLEKVTD